LFFVLIQEPKIKSAATLLCALGPLPRKQVKPGEGPVAAFAHSPSLQATFRTLLQPHRPASFYLLSPEAARLTGPPHIGGKYTGKLNPLSAAGEERGWSSEA